MPPQGFGVIKNNLIRLNKKKQKLKKMPKPHIEPVKNLASIQVITDTSEIRCYGCQKPSLDCTVPCIFPQKCFIRATDFNFTCK